LQSSTLLPLLLLLLLLPLLLLLLLPLLLLMLMMLLLHRCRTTVHTARSSSTGPTRRVSWRLGRSLVLVIR